MPLELLMALQRRKLNLGRLASLDGSICTCASGRVAKETAESPLPASFTGPSDNPRVRGARNRVDESALVCPRKPCIGIEKPRMTSAEAALDSSHELTARARGWGLAFTCM